MLIGIDAPPGTDEAGLKEFNDFYTWVHIGEVVAAMKFHRGSRYELYPGVQASNTGFATVPRSTRETKPH
jgi:hypothetical protein